MGRLTKTAKKGFAKTMSEELNQGTNINLDMKLVKTDLCRWAFQASNISDKIFNPGLIGFLNQNSLPWFSKKFGPHPGPKSHLEFTKKIVYPVLDNKLQQKDNDQWITSLINRTDDLWTQ